MAQALAAPQAQNPLVLPATNTLADQRKPKAKSVRASSAPPTPATSDALLAPFLASLTVKKPKDAGKKGNEQGHAGEKHEQQSPEPYADPYPEPSIRRTGWLYALIGQHKPGTPTPLANTPAAQGLRVVDLPLEDPEGVLLWDPPNDEILQGFYTVDLEALFIFSQMFDLGGQDFEFPPYYVGSAVSETGHRVIALPTVYRVRKNIDPLLVAAVILYDPVIAFVALGAFDKYLRTRNKPVEYFTPLRTADALMRGYRFTLDVIMPLIRITESCPGNWTADSAAKFLIDIAERAG
ncbi:unnamed protein product [Zymoseptoria tritici ST99CH_1A5]|uniref:Uncharacterized protein n=1 Tax=Zymoseptoria tritici ST99CH_1A5 TaxID=1276529 RepID=A0A1Y6M0I4_ZYMTR|nr:unnamed protein product [Zymoseptoria tritici ST99CH_1A5]